MEIRSNISVRGNVSLVASDAWHGYLVVAALGAVEVRAWNGTYTISGGSSWGSALCLRADTADNGWIELEGFHGSLVPTDPKVRP